MERDYCINHNRDKVIYDRRELIRCNECLELEQALITQKNRHNAFSVEREYINSKLYHDKFEKLPLNKIVQEAVYREAGRLLEFIDSLEENQMVEERLVALNARTGQFLVDNFDREGTSCKTGFNEDEHAIIDRCPDSIVLIHNHSLNGMPSGQDLLSYLHNEKIRVSLIACHDGTLYAIYGVKKEFEETYKKILNENKLRTNDIEVAKRLTMDELYPLNATLSARHKIFNVQEL